jgi:hypothetical protein
LRTALPDRASGAVRDVPHRGAAQV